MPQKTNRDGRRQKIYNIIYIYIYMYMKERKEITYDAQLKRADRAKEVFFSTT